MFLAPEVNSFVKMSKMSPIINVMVVASYLVKFHEFPNTVEHVVVLGSGAGHLLYDGSDMTKDRGIQQGWNHIYRFLIPKNSAS